MSIQMLRRFTVLFFLAVLLAGCSSSGPRHKAGASSARSVHSDNCRFNRSNCIYEGSYEAGESVYAEEEARRLNQASIRRLRRGGWR